MLYTDMLINCDGDDDDTISHVANDRYPTQTGISNEGNALAYD